MFCDPGTKSLRRALEAQASSLKVFGMSTRISLRDFNMFTTEYWTSAHSPASPLTANKPPRCQYRKPKIFPFPTPMSHQDLGIKLQNTTQYSFIQQEPNWNSGFPVGLLHPSARVPENHTSDEVLSPSVALRFNPRSWSHQCPSSSNLSALTYGGPFAKTLPPPYL